MEIISLDNDEPRNSSNINENNHLIGSYTDFFNKRPGHDLQKNILIEIEIIYYEKNSEENNNYNKSKLI